MAAPPPSPTLLSLSASVALLIDDLTAAVAVPDVVKAFADTSAPPTSSVAQLLEALSELLALPVATRAVARRFRGVLVDLVVRWLDQPVPLQEGGGWAEREQRRVGALAWLVEVHEEIEPVLSAYLALLPSPLAPLLALQPQAIHSLPTSTLHSLLLSLFRLARANPLFLRSNWSLAPVHHLLTLGPPHPDAGVRLLASWVLALGEGFSEQTRREWEERYLGTIETVGDIWVQYGEEVVDGQIVGKTVDGWALLIAEELRMDGYRATFSDPLPLLPEDSPLPRLSASDLHPRTAFIAGVLLPRPSTPPSPSPLIATTSNTSALHHLSLAISSRIPALITAPPSSGKTTLLSHLSALLHAPAASPPILTIHAADPALDAKSLLGAYVSTPEGGFEHREGALVKAVRAGMWVVLRDIDRAPQEVLSTVSKLVQSLGPTKRVGQRAQLSVPGREPVEAGRGFMLFATRSVNPSRSGAYLKPAFLGAAHWLEVEVAPPSSNEVIAILAGRHPRLAAVASDLVSVFEAARKATTAPGSGRAGAARELGLRDLLKWARRVDTLLPASSAPPTLDDITRNPVVQEEILIEALDVFFAHLPSLPASTAFTPLASALGINAERVEWIIKHRAPELAPLPSTSELQVGRARLAVHPSATPTSAAGKSKKPFALTRPSLNLLETLAVPVHLSEPLLLVGETGTGKTTLVSHLASLLNRPLVSLNLSHQTESSDLLGSFRPLDPRAAAVEMQAEFEALFGRTFDAGRNKAFGEAVRKAYLGGKWERLVKGWREARRMAKVKEEKERARDAENASQADGPRKKRRTELTPPSNAEREQVYAAWAGFEAKVTDFEAQHVSTGKGKGRFVFSFVEGPLVTALRRGDWILLDEVNLASPETLECLSSLLAGPDASIVLTERGDLTPVPRHPDFRLFACMNPATDVGKKDLPPNLRSRFTEVYVPPPDNDRDALVAIVTQYIGPHASGDRAAILDVAELYTAIKTLAERRELADGSNQRPHFSMRTLARALTFAADVAPVYGLRRALWEGWLMAFTMLLDEKSGKVVRALVEKHIIQGAKNPRAVLSQAPVTPSGEGFLGFGHFWLERGPEPLDAAEDYVLTPSVQAKLIDLARVVLTRRFPVLIQGPTSAGKTSAVEYLARRTGHRFVRINNHEHTDIQEYLGTYVSDPETGKFEFQEGVLVRALRRGDWIVLDELNLAPTDVLEALNRLLDDNRELVIPETGEVVRPHPHFMLFATQNPPGLYAGRKVLSRAFRNRFLEVHFEDVPQAELETILCQRCRIAPSYASKIVAVFRELQKRRQAERVFENKQSFATLRDLFRWAGRDAIGYQQLAENGYMLLAERARRPDDQAVVREVIEDVMKVSIDEASLYTILGLDQATLTAKIGCGLPPPSPDSPPIVWTKMMQRLFALVASALRYNEPVLLVGETGTGKTSVCQVLADALGRSLRSISCHQNTETADLLGGQRPIRNRSAIQSALIADAAAFLREAGFPLELEIGDLDTLAAVLEQALAAQDPPADFRSTVRGFQRRMKQATALFEWHDGPLVEAMRQGDIVLLDEISLADDAVLERLNSVLEPSRSLVLAEKGGRDVDHIQVVGAPGFEIIATMNPGGDYGKKELSPALRNRFTEIWVPALNDRADLETILESAWTEDALRGLSGKILDFAEWFTARSFGGGGISTINIGLRDFLAWSSFIKSVFPRIPVQHALTHGAAMSIVDSLQQPAQVECFTKLAELAEIPASLAEDAPLEVVSNENVFAIGDFAVPKGPHPVPDSQFSLLAPTTRKNAMRVLRALQVPKPILLEGSPGVGKTSLVSALADASGRRLVRINLSDQTDLMDLFGSDLPVEGGKAGEFAWRDAAFLSAMQAGDWVLLDEMNLASQAVLEGLNAVLDHRGSVYLPELGKSFDKHPDFRVFAAQNPVAQGGGRKGLPQSFLNRFTKVYVTELRPDDLLLICRQLYPLYPPELLERMIVFNTRMQNEIVLARSFGCEGSPWEFNLRDLLRWLALLHKSTGLELNEHPSEYLAAIYLDRLRTEDDRRAACAIFADVFGDAPAPDLQPWTTVTSQRVQVGHTLAQRLPTSFPSGAPNLATLQSGLRPLETLARCFDLGWLVILAGPAASGKTSLVRHFAALSGRRLHEFDMNAAVDTMELLGSFEQADPLRALRDVLDRLVVELDAARAAVLPGDLWATLEAHSASLATSRAGLGLKGTTPATTVLAFAREAVGDLARMPVQPSTLESLRVSLDAVAENAHRASAGRFEWVDGVLIRAMQAGDWLLIDDANLCNPSVLDRLNSLFETNGTLVLSERGMVGGQVQVIRPHPDFRLVMALDPRNGELSRAMRNRGIEISLSPLSIADRERVQALARLPADPLQPHLPAAVASVEQARRQLGERAVPVAVIPSPARILASDSSVATEASFATPLALATSELPASSLKIDAAIIRFVQSLPPTPARLALGAHLLNALQLGEVTTRATFAVQQLVQHPVLQILRSARDEAALVAQVESGFFASQPMNLLFNPNLAKVDAAAFAALARAVEVLVRQLLADHDANERLRDAARKPIKSLSVLEKATLLRAGRTLASGVDGGATAISTMLTATRTFLHAVCGAGLASAPQAAEPLLVLAYVAWELARELEDASRTADFDYSTVRVILDSYQDALESAPVAERAVDELRQTVGGLRETVTLTSGHGLREIWAAFLPAATSPEAVTLGKQLRRFGADVPSQLRASFLEILASLGLPSIAEQVIPLAQELSHKLDSATAGDLVDGKAVQDVALSSILETVVLASLVQPGSLPAQLSGKVLFQRLLPGSPDVRSLVGLQQALWSVDAGLTSLPRYAFAEAALSWLERAWASERGDNVFVGPADLFRPALMRGITAHSDVKIRRSLRELDTFQQSVQQDSKLLAVLARGPRVSRSQAVRNIIVAAVRSVVESFASSFAADEHDIAAAFAPGQGGRLDVDAIAGLLLSSEHPQFRQAASEVFVPALQGVSESSVKLAALGRAGVDIAVACLRLYLPNLAIDPAVAARARAGLARHREERLRAEIWVAEQAERAITGNDASPILLSLRARLAELKAAEAPGDALSAVRDTDLQLLTAMYQELQHFLGELFKGDKLAALISRIERGVDAQCLSQEQTVQQTISGFLQRLGRAYGLFDDILLPLRLFLHMLKLGLRTFAQAHRLDEAPPLATLVNDLAGFPSVAAARSLASAELPTQPIEGSTPAPPAHLLLLAVSAAAFEVASGAALAAHVPHLDRVYGQLYHLWAVDRERERIAQEEEQSLYKQRKQDESVLSDVEAEEADLRSIFPEFGDVLDGGAAAAGKGTSSSKKSTLVGQLDGAALHHLHNALFAAGLNERSASADEARRVFRARGQAVLSDSVASLYSGLSETLDAQSLPLLVSMAARLDRQDGDDSDHLGVSGVRDFYKDANIPEIRKALPILTDLSARLEQLFRDWPEQIILQHLNERCQAILALDVRTSPAMMLSALEQLLLHTEDWESYASRETTLKPQRDAITNLIVEWRRLELACWAQLLEHQAHVFEANVSAWWFRLYEAVVRGVEAAAASEADALAAHLKSLVELLDRFLLTSPAGQYSARLAVLVSFGRFLHFLAPHKPDHVSRAFADTARLLHGVVSFYRQFEPQVLESLKRQRAALEKNIQDWIKLASWKDINVYALRASAQKTHRQLHKSIRKFREILEQPVEPLLAFPPDSTPSISHSPIDVLHQPLSTPTDMAPLSPSSRPPADFPKHLLNLPSTFARLRDVVASARADDEVGRPLEELATAIVTTSKALAAETPALASDENKGVVKNLGMRKKKAWTDLLKELKRIGLAANLKPEAAAALRDTAGLFQLPALSSIQAEPSSALPLDMMDLLGRAEAYHYRLLAVLPRLRTSLASHDADISTRDLQRAVNFVESGMLIAIAGRTRLASAVTTFKSLRSVVDRLASTYSTEESAVLARGAHSLKAAVIGLYKALRQVSEAAAEMQFAVTDYSAIAASQVSSDAAVASSRLVELRAHVADQAAALAPLVMALQKEQEHFLTQGELQLVRVAQDELPATRSSLDELARHAPELAFIFQPAISWLDDVIRELGAFAGRSQTRTVEEVWIQSDRIINSVLVIAQKLPKASSGVDSLDAELRDSHVTDQDRALREATAALQLEPLLEDVTSFLSAIARASAADASDLPSLSAAARRVFPFLAEFTSLAERQLARLAQWHKALLKLVYVLCSTVRTVAEKGFCRPPEADDGAGGETSQDDGKLEEGTGMGEGQGAENVSSQIENEEQVEGLQDEKGDDSEERGETKREDEAIEMNEDFDADLDNVSDADEEKGSQDGADDEEQDLDEEMGDVDPLDPGAVDEKLWGEEGPESKENDDRVNQEPQAQPEGPSETVAKDDAGNDNKDRERPPESEEAQPQDAFQDEQEGGPEEQAADEEPAGPKGGDKVDQRIPEPDTLDLPEGMELDGKEEKSDGEDYELSDGEMDAEGDEQVEDDTAMPEDQPSPPAADEPDASGAPTQDVPEDDTAEAEPTPAEAQASEVEQPENEDGSDPDALQPEAKQDGVDDSMDEPAADTTASGDADPNATTEQSGAAQDNAGQRADAAEADREVREDQAGKPSEPQPTAADPAALRDGPSGDGEAAPAPGSEAPDASMPRPEPNPLRSLGDAMKEFRRRFDEIAEAQDHDEPAADRQATEAEEPPQQLEYLREEDADNMQALGAAPEDQVQKLGDLRIADEEEQGPEHAGEMDLRENESEHEPQHTARPTLQNAPTSAPADSEKAITGAELRQQTQPERPEAAVDRDVDMDVEEYQEPEESPALTDEERKELEHRAELRLQQWRAGHGDADAEGVWRLYESLTRDLSFSLCEQLRLILEPTLATRLKGDYRTGKRLSMRKIIPYIASDFSKDKIWLRRTRPSQREYQIMLAVDDSRSMANSHTTHLAFQALTLISKALTLLDVPPAITRFGRTAEVVHDFDTALTDETGARLLENFTFTQDATDVLALLANSLDHLQTSRASRPHASAAADELPQLLIIISDGICQEHERLRVLLRRAEEQRVCVVFVVLDSLRPAGPSTNAPRSSILSMSSAAVVNGQLQLTRYLDSFPFENFVVLRDLGQLPDVLCSLLRQFFESMATA